MSENSELFDRVIKRWGINLQFNLLAEECAELAVVALHCQRTNDTREHLLMRLASEIADVQIMIETILYCLKDAEVDGVYFSDGVRSCQEAKLEKLKNRLEAKL